MQQTRQSKLGTLLPSAIIIFFFFLQGCGVVTTITFSKKEIVDVITLITVQGADGKQQNVATKFDTGAYRCSIDIKLAESLGLEYIKDRVFPKKEEGMHCEDNQIFVTPSNGKGSCRYVVEIIFEIKGITVVAEASVKDRANLSYDLSCGRRVLQRHNLLVDSENGPNEDELALNEHL